MDKRLKGGRNGGTKGRVLDWTEPSFSHPLDSDGCTPEFCALSDAPSSERRSSASNLDRIEFQLTRTKESMID